MLVQNHTKATFRARAFFTASGSTSSSIYHGGGTVSTLAPEEQHWEQYVRGGGLQREWAVWGSVLDGVAWKASLRRWRLN